MPDGSLCKCVKLLSESRHRHILSVDVLPASSESLVQIHGRDVLIAYGVAQPNLGIEISALGVEHVDVVQATSTILHMSELDILACRIAQFGPEGGSLMGTAVACDSVVDLGEGCYH